MSRKVTRRELLRVSALVGAGALLAACQPKIVEVEKVVTKEVEKIVKETVEVEKEKIVEKEVTKVVEVEKVVKEIVIPAPKYEGVTIRFMSSYPITGTHPRAEFMQRVKELFEAKHPGVTVEMERVPDIDVRWKTETAARTLPVMLWDANMFCEMAEQGVFLELDDRLEDHPEVNLEKDYVIPGGAECMVYHQGKVVAMPYILSGPVMLCNMDLFDRNGIERPPDDWTWNDLLDICKELTQDTTGDGRIDQWGFNGGTTWDENFTQWIWTAGGEIISEDHKHTLVDSPEAKAAIQFYYDLRFKHNVWPRGEDTETMSVAGITNPFAAGKVGIQCSNWGAIGAFKAFPDLNYDLLHFPKFPGNDKRYHWIFMQNFAAPSWSEYPELDADLVIELGGPSSQRYAGRLKIQCPSYKKAIEEDFATPPPENARVILEIFAQYEVNHLPIFTGKTEWCVTVFGGELTKAFIGEVDLDTAIKEAVLAGDRVLASY